jgi:hypothetical protein
LGQVRIVFALAKLEQTSLTSNSRDAIDLLQLRWMVEKSKVFQSVGGMKEEDGSDKKEGSG